MKDKELLKQAIFVLNTIFGEIAVSVNTYRTHLERLTDKNFDDCSQDAIFRYQMLISQVAISCTKYVEFCRVYNKTVHELVPHMSKDMNKLQEEIKNRGLVEFRNDYVGHIHSKALGRPLTEAEYAKVQDKVTQSDMESFLEWLIPSDLGKTGTLQSVCCQIFNLQKALDQQQK
ncbi:hypothetical protein THF5H11_370001 [Vibrio jasicida]|uniref:hypothetical protein n=1 Tax=Vibrio jasicida TaxID=766224 RepID=UPI0028960D0E|nr:hypothetical protein THF5H11_370001 [Vibrio jasicida]